MKVCKGSSVYAQTRLPRCDKCGKGFVTLKVINVNGKTQALCSGCQTAASASGGHTVLRQ